MRKRNRKSIRWTATTLLAVLSLMAAATCTIPAYAQQADAPTPTPVPKTDIPPAVANDGASTPDNATAITDPESMLPHFKNTRYWLSGQANFIFQTHPDFHADYSGPHSLSPRYEKDTSRLMTLYNGVRPQNSF